MKPLYRFIISEDASLIISNYRTICKVECISPKNQKTDRLFSHCSDLVCAPKVDCFAAMQPYNSTIMATVCRVFCSKKKGGKKGQERRIRKEEREEGKGQLF